MNNIALRTLIFVGVAVVCVGGAIATSRFTEPVKLSDASLAGEEFYPDFQDPTKATALRVAAYDKDAAEVKVFNVEFKDGLWRIPSHHFYPADGEEQLARTAASVVGIKRGTFAGKTPADHKRMGVLDPLDESITGTEGRGSRITLYQGEKALVDFIIGSKLEGSEDDYYVRKADDAQVYRAELSGLQISTKFADWIEPDLLKLDRNKLSQMIVDKYHIDEQRGAIVQEEVNVLSKPAGATTWALERLDDQSEKLKTPTVTQMVSALDDLKIVGVRPKPSGLIGVLTGREGAALNQLEVLQMQRAGYFLTPDGQLVSNEGEILAGTNEGVRYSLRFGEVISGTDLDIEVGSGDATADEAPATDEAAGTDDATAAADETADPAVDSADETDAEDNGLQSNRYLFITASFDESLLGERPQPPVKPEPPSATPTPTSEEGAETPQENGEPAAETPADAESPTEGESPDESAGDAEGAPESSDSAEPSSEADPAADPEPASDPQSQADPAATPPAAEAAEAAETDPAQPAEGTTEPATEAEPVDPEAAQQAYEAALAKYEEESATYDIRLQAYEDKVEAGRKLATELNERFAEWYYVISGDLFKQLQVSRAELVEAVPAPAGDADAPATDADPAAPATEADPATPATDSDAAAPSTESDPAAPAAESDAAAPAESTDPEGSPAENKPESTPEPAASDPADPEL